MRRIVVYGVTGSGKSTLAARVGERLGIPYHSIDDLTWRPGWVPKSDQEQRDLIRALLAGDEWVIDAGYAIWMDLVLERADLIVGLDMPRWVSYTRLVRRTVGNIVHKRAICNGNYETWRLALLSRDSMLYFHIGSFRRKQARMRLWQASPEFPETVLLHSPAEAERWLDGLKVG
ncbi:adenylate kinase [Actinoplanes sp. Pm04-4]|uniref:Adenylate kinase n=1 Tax=Paractinoplanes pyxinae TaxID=2997416 RepID=A0ABT4B0J9_9ACTN|nr:adenylate kinase [Actinoplanes pyxinae]MCY1139979.1 adenylate kinase [Actinoplanes pyxinae]